MPTLEAIARRVRSAEDLLSVVTTMKALAGASIRRDERAVDALRSYQRTVEMGLQVALAAPGCDSRPDDATPPGGRARPIRIVALGDSTTEAGWEGNAKSVYAERLAAALEAHGVEAEVINAGISDTTSLQAVERPKARLARQRIRVAGQRINTDPQGTNLVAEGKVEATLLPGGQGTDAVAAPGMFLVDEAVHFVQQCRDLLNLVDYDPTILRHCLRFAVQPRRILTKAQRLGCVEKIIDRGILEMLPDPGGLPCSAGPKQKDRVSWDAQQSCKHSWHYCRYCAICQCILLNRVPRTEPDARIGSTALEMRNYRRLMANLTPLTSA